MDIISALATQQQPKTTQDEPKTGDSYISNGVFVSALIRAGVDEEIISDCLLEPRERRGELLSYFEGLI
jgi:hypothetical protein